MEKKAFKISFFIHVWEKKSDEILLEEFYKDLKGPRWKVLAESYRRKLMQGKEEQAKKQKAALNAVVIAGRCKGGHSASQVKELNGLALFDFDHCPGKLIRMKEKSMTLPYVVASFVSISGEGLKVIVRVDAEDARRYATAYSIVAGELEYELNQSLRHGVQRSGACVLCFV